MSNKPIKILSHQSKEGNQLYLVDFGDESGQPRWVNEKTIGPSFKQLFQQMQINEIQQEKQYTQIDPLIKNPKKQDLKNVMGIESQPINQVPCDEMYGDLEYGDQPNKILKVWRKGNELEFIVDWLQWQGGFQPKNSVVTNTELKKWCPDILMTFYEDHMIFKDLKEEN